MSEELCNCRRGVVGTPKLPFLLVQIFHIYSINTLPLTLASNLDLSGLYSAPVTIWWITYLSGFLQHRSHSPTRFRCLCGPTPRPSVVDLVTRMVQARGTRTPVQGQGWPPPGTRPGLHNIGKLRVGAAGGPGRSDGQAAVGDSTRQLAGGW